MRPAGAIAAARAGLNYLGEAGYQRKARTIMETKAKLIDGINLVPCLKVLEPKLCIFVYTGSDPDIDIGAVADAMVKRGWFVGWARSKEVAERRKVVKTRPGAPLYPL
ncbi:MAG: hypothetical protein JNM30_10245 [Rhodospirillales bacterium]|nr:hypothetical protein [Rhodospirillales bacterium]